MDPDRIEAALAALGPESRALVELSVIREVADDDIADLLGTDEGAVRGRREDALAQLAAALGADSAEEVGSLVRDMRELPAVRWRDDETSDLRPQTSGPRPSRRPDPPSCSPARSAGGCWAHCWPRASSWPSSRSCSRSPAVTARG